MVDIGSPTAATGRCESAALRHELMRLGVPADRILVEALSANTRENVTMAWPVIREWLAGRRLTSVVAVCKWMHSRRVLMTLKANFPANIRYHAVTYAPDGYSRADWLAGVAAPQTAAVMRNWLSLPAYLSSGHIAEVSRHPAGGWV